MKYSHKSVAAVSGMFAFLAITTIVMSARSSMASAESMQMESANNIKVYSQQDIERRIAIPVIDDRNSSSSSSSAQTAAPVVSDTCAAATDVTTELNETLVKVLPANRYVTQRAAVQKTMDALIKKYCGATTK